MEMKEGPSRRVMIGVGVASVVFIILLPLLQEPFSQRSFPTFESWNKYLWERGNGIAVEWNGTMKLHLRRLVRGENLTQLEATGISCLYDVHFEQCIIEKPVIITSTKPLVVYIPSTDRAPENFTIKPYARREDPTAMNEVTPVQVLHGNHGNNINYTSCEVKDELPAMVFSSGGFTGNIFHEFNEIAIPLFITSRHFDTQLEFVITDYGGWWVDKYKEILKKLSPFEVVNGDADGRVHCFPGAVIGLRYYGDVAVKSSEIPRGYKLSDFRHFIGDAYNLTIDGPLRPKSRPTVLLISRQKTRVLLNENEIIKMMEDMGFQVHKVLANETPYLDHFAKVVNSYDVILGVHGAGLMNELFLRDGSVVVQVVPLTLDWAAENYYGISAHVMGLKYFEYKIEPKESSLYDVYGPDDPIVSNLTAAIEIDYRVARAIYIDGQNITINVARLKGTFIEVLKFWGYPTP